MAERELEGPSEPVEPVSNEEWQDWSALMARTSVFLAWKKNDEPERVHVGSGVALRTSCGVPFVLTAEHVARDAFSHPSKFGVQNEEPGGYPLFDCRGQSHPDERVDVAIVVPAPGSELWDALLRASASVDVVEPSYERTHRPGDIYIVFGYPAIIVDVDRDEQEIRYKGFEWPCDPGEPPILRPDDMLEFKWVDSGALLFDIRNPGVAIGTAPAAAGGMSGGPLWRHRIVIDPATKVSATQTASRIVAVQRDYRDRSRDVYLDPSERWYDWLMRRVRSLDEQARG